MSALLSAGRSAGASLVSGFFGNRAAKKAANASFNYQAELNNQTARLQSDLNDQAFRLQNALLTTQNGEVRALNDRVDRFNADVLANHSTERRSETRSERTVATSFIDLNRLVRDSEAAGFNPLTVMRSGLGAGWATAHTDFTSDFSSAFTPARSLMTYFAPGETPQINHPGQAATGVAPTVQPHNPIGDAAIAGVNQFLNYDRNAAARAEMERALGLAQIRNLDSDTARNRMSLTPTAWTAPTTVRSRPAGGGSGSRSSGLLGSTAVPSAGDIKVTNPFLKGGTVSTGRADAAAYEDRYGEILSVVPGAHNAIEDAMANLNRATNNAGLRAGNVIKQQAAEAASWLQSIWNNPAWNAK